jgi:prolipoprotein diacylglyceryltransferase
LSLFSLLIGLGASLALLRLAFTVAAEIRIRWLLHGLAVFAGALLAARLVFVLEHLAYYSTRQIEILNFSSGGLWWPGAAVGGLMVTLVIGILRHRKVKETFDKFNVFLLPLALSFWLAAWRAGVGYGARLDSSVWWGMPMLDISGVTTPRVPVQPAAALTILMLLGAMEWVWKKPAPAGRRMAVLLLVLSVHTLLFSLMRTDPVQPFFGIRLDVWISILLIFVSGILLACTFEVKSRKSQMEKDLTA